MNERKKYNLIRVDSSIVSESVGKLTEGLDNKSGKKAVKYSIAFYGILSCDSNVFTSPRYSSEDVALPEVVMNHIKKESNHQNMYVLDRVLAVHYRYIQFQKYYIGEISFKLNFFKASLASLIASQSTKSKTLFTAVRKISWSSSSISNIFWYNMERMYQLFQKRNLQINVKKCDGLLPCL